LQVVFGKQVKPTLVQRGRQIPPPVGLLKSTSQT
jgi:hypothetical protein